MRMWFQQVVVENYIQCLNIFSCFHPIISSLSLLILSYPAWSRQLPEGLRIVIISVYLDSCCVAKHQINMRYVVWNTYCWQEGISVVCRLVPLFSCHILCLPAIGTSKVANPVLMSHVFSCLQDQSVISTRCFISHRGIFFSSSHWA